MIRRSFIFLEKIASGKEQSIWRQGVRDWQEFKRKDKITGISKQKKEYYNRKISEAIEALKSEDAGFFVGKLPQKEMWRLYDFFRDECCFLDIEIDGMGRITLVGISNYYNSNFFVRGVNLDRKLIEKEIAKYQVVITFNGGAFDLPKLRKMGVSIHKAHIDLKPLCVNLDLKGGLKEVENILGLRRPQHLRGNPVDLWKAFHASGDREWLDLLIEYNREDVENLKGVADAVYKRMEKIYKLHIQC